MALLTEPVRDKGLQRTLWIVGALAAIAIILSVFSLVKPSRTQTTTQTQNDPLQSVTKDGVLRVGYGGFPPYTIIDANQTDPNLRVKGFSVDLVNEIARRQTPPLRVEWHNLNWDTLKADMLSGKFDFIADPVFQTVPRSIDFGLCEPYSYFGIAVAVVRKDDNRFKEFKDLDREDITISLAEGWTSSEFAKQNLTKPKFKSVPVTGDAVTQLDDVLFGRADVALNDVPTVAQYVKAHSDKVKALWLDRPPSSVPGGFMTRKEDVALRAFLDNATRIMIADGTLKRLDEKWQSYGFIPELRVSPGRGLSEPASQNATPK